MVGGDGVPGMGHHGIVMLRPGSFVALLVATGLLVAVIGTDTAAGSAPAVGPAGSVAPRPLPSPIERVGETALPATAIVPGTVGRTSLALSATYDVAARLEYDRRYLLVVATLSVRNDSGAGIDRVELNALPGGLGILHLGHTYVDGREVDATVADQTIVVPLGGVLPAGASAIVRTAYSATLRAGTAGSDWMFTRTNGVVALYRWIPWVSRARPFDRPNHGDPFVTPVSPKVSIRLTTDRPLVIGTAGRRVSTSGLTQSFEATMVRDVSLTAAPDYTSGSRSVGDTLVRAYVRGGVAAGPRLDAATAALSKLEALLGPYPYPTLVVAQTGGGYGMESPGVVWIPAGVAAANLPYLVTHEVAHQWFYGLVGNDQANEPFTDEAAADFAARRVLGMRRSSGCATDALDRTIYAYSAACYYETIYVGGGNLIDDQRRKMGDAAFWPALRAYIDRYAWTLAPRGALLDTLDAATPLDLRAGYAARFPRWY